MLFNSPIYIFLFLPITVAVYFALTRLAGSVASKIWLVAASLFFYAWWNPVYLWLIVASILLNFSLGLAIQKHKRGQRMRLARSLMITGVVLNLAALGWFKYADFFIANINWLADATLAPLQLVLPLAISFFTFQQIAYLVDVYGAETREYDFLNYCLFVTFFPQLIAGPIVHHREMMPQFGNPQNAWLDWNRLAQGLFIFFLGLAKKVLVADTFAQWANAGFDGGDPLGLWQAWGVSLSYTFQLYYDFSGYSDMAIGAALMLNIRLPVNFNSPYRALDIQDFWRRWHMTLSRWLRDYLYIPLGGNRKGPSRTYVNLMLTFLLGGLWHGAGWTFVAWGALHGLALCVHRLWSGSGRRLPRFPAWALTFLFANLAWVFFRAPSFEAALQLLAGMAGLNGWQLPETAVVPAVAMAWLGIFGLVAFLLPNSLQIAGYIDNDVGPAGGLRRHLRLRQNLAWALLLSLLVFASSLTFLGTDIPAEFLYFNF